MADYMHGVRIQENPTSISTPVVNQSGVPVIFGTAPVNLAADPSNATNRLFFCNDFAEAKAAVGYSEDYNSYTLCQGIDAFFKVFGVGPVVLCNVLDPATHKKVYEETLQVTNNQAVSTKEGVLLSDLIVKSDTSDLVLGTDFTVEFNDKGQVVVTIIAEGVTSVNLSGNMIDPSAVTADDIIGSYDAETGKETGMELVRKVYHRFGVAPGLLLAPGWSHIPGVGTTLAAKCKDVSGVFKSECVVDIDCSATGATKYTDVEKVKNDSGYLSEHMIALWPMVTYAGKRMAYSAIYAAMAAYTDFNNDSVPNLSPSNHALKIGATVLADGTEVDLDTSQANELNAVGVVTAVNMNGFKAWGNNTAAYPGITDPKDRWINCRRFFSWWGNSFIMNYLEKVDDNTNYRLIESIVDSENVRGNSLVSQGKCAGIKMVYRRADNPIAKVLDGKVVFRQHLAPYTPAEDILNILEFDPSMIEAALGGE